MPKKIFISTVIILAVVAATIPFKISQKTFAEDREQIWTIPELIAMEADESSPKTDAEQTALNSFQEMMLLITSINPANSTIKVLFHDRDRMLEEMIGEETHATLEELYIAWFTENPSMYNVDYARRGNYPEGTYFPLFGGSDEANGENWFAPNIEVELPIQNAEALYNQPYMIHFAMEADINNVAGAHDYSDCMDSPAYEQGMECKMVFNDRGWFYFLPFLPGSDTPVEDPNWIDYEQIIGEGSGGQEFSDDMVGFGDGYGSENTEISAENAKKPEFLVPKTPNTGKK